MNKDKEIKKINSCISELVYDKVALKKAYNYYHCKRDPEQFKHIEDNYGLGTPTAITFTPLIKKHIDVLVGEYLELDPDLQVTCKDEETVSNIMRDKQLKIHEAAFKFFKQKLENVLLQIFQEGKQPVVDPYFDKEVERIKRDIEKSYVSQYEVAAQNILKYIKHSRDIDFKVKMQELLTDLLIGGMCYYRVKPSGSKTSLEFEVLNPVNTFIERNPNHYYLNRSPRAVIRKWMTRDQILAEFGDELSSEAKSKLEKEESSNYNRNSGIYVTAYTEKEPLPKGTKAPGLLGGLEVHPFAYSEGSMLDHVYEVYECEWIEFDKEHNRLTRHEGVKISHEIYIVRGESEYITRSMSNPKDCTLTINGIFFEDKNGDPFSIVLNTMDLQDWI